MSQLMSHACPGCGKKGIPHARVSCRNCWYRLPVALQRPITAAYDGGRGQGSIGHYRALADAIAWYRANPAKAGIRARTASRRTDG